MQVAAVVCTNKATPTNVLSITELEPGKFSTGIKLTNIIWIIIWYAHFSYYHIYKIFNAA